MAPNPIDFDLVFTEFVRLSETGNVAVIIAVGCVFGLYLLLIPWARKFDRHDLLKVNTNFVLTAYDVSSKESFRYREYLE